MGMWSILLPIGLMILTGHVRRRRGEGGEEEGRRRGGGGGEEERGAGEGRRGAEVERS